MQAGACEPKCPVGSSPVDEIAATLFTEKIRRRPGLNNVNSRSLSATLVVRKSGVTKLGHSVWEYLAVNIFQ